MKIKSTNWSLKVLRKTEIILSFCPSQGSHTQETLEGYKLQKREPVSNTHFYPESQV